MRRLLFFILLLSAGAAPLFASTPAHSCLGIAHWGAAYTVTATPSLVEGAQMIQNLNSTNIFLTLSSRYNTADYPTENDFGAGVHSLVTLAQSPPFQKVFQ